MDRFDLLVVGGGINGAAIARDAALRGQKVLLVEKDDLAGHTSSASSKLIHGGLRYLEHYEFRLVRESLAEREILLQSAPHIVRPLKFVLPHAPSMRPWWMVRIGLLLYDLLAGRKSSLGRSHGLRRDEAELAAPLQPHARRRLATYWDAWVDDARLVALNAVAAAQNGAEIATRTELLSARRAGEHWIAELGGGRTVEARAIVNAGGAWVGEVLGQRLGETVDAGVRLIKGSHILVPRLYEADHAYILQQPDRRVVFALPYGEHNLIGTTDVAASSPDDTTVSAEEIAYLCDAVNRYFERRTAPGDLVWSYAGIRALYDDGAAAAQSVTRDYRLELDPDPGPKLLSVFGGKITTARALAQEAMETLGIEGRKRTVLEPLPGGDIMPEFNQYLEQLSGWLPAPLLHRLATSYGTRLPQLLAGATSLKQLGRHFGAGLYEAEVRYLRETEFARAAEDVLWRRTKLGLRLTPAEQEALAQYLDAPPSSRRRPGPQGE